jgi:hypothetical protein
MSTLNHSDVYAVTTTSTHKPSASPTYAIINLDSRSCIPAEYLHWWQDAYRAATAVGRKEDPDFYTERAVMAARWDVVFYMLHKHSKLYKALYRLAMYDPRLLITLLSEDNRCDMHANRDG